MNLSKTTHTFSLANIWLVLLILSFSYDRPIYLFSNIDRLNPRLFDVVTIIGFILLLKKGIPVKILNPIYKSYLRIVLWFVFCTLIGILLYNFPIRINGFSIFFVGKYLQELFICFVLITYLKYHKIDYHKLFKLIAFCGVFVSFYCFYEYNAVDTSIINITSDLSIIKSKGLIWGPFRMSYFQISNYSPIVGFITLCYSLSKKGFGKYIYIFLSIIIYIPSLYSGSRASVGLLLILLFVASLLELKFRKILVFVFFLVFGFAFFNVEIISESLFVSENVTFNRFVNMSDINVDNSVLGRLNLFLIWFYRFSEYAYNGFFVPFIGGGFYVAPMNGSYRIGFGWHNIYLFVVEQAGIFGLVLFYSFIKKVLNTLRANYKQLKKHTVEHWFVFSVRVIFISIIIIGIFGAHSFWNGFSTGNFNSFRLVLIILATHSFIKNTHEKNIIN